MRDRDLDRVGVVNLLYGAVEYLGPGMFRDVSLEECRERGLIGPPISSASREDQLLARLNKAELQLKVAQERIAELELAHGRP